LARPWGGPCSKRGLARQSGLGKTLAGPCSNSGLGKTLGLARLCFRQAVAPWCGPCAELAPKPKLALNWGSCTACSLAPRPARGAACCCASHPAARAAPRSQPPQQPGAAPDTHPWMALVLPWNFLAWKLVECVELWMHRNALITPSTAYSMSCTSPPRKNAHPPPPTHTRTLRPTHHTTPCGYGKAHTHPHEGHAGLVVVALVLHIHRRQHLLQAHGALPVPPLLLDLALRPHAVDLARDGAQQHLQAGVVTQ
jgi:hypothetical protein